MNDPIRRDNRLFSWIDTFKGLFVITAIGFSLVVAFHKLTEMGIIPPIHIIIGEPTPIPTDSTPQPTLPPTPRPSPTPLPALPEGAQTLIDATRTKIQDNPLMVTGKLTFFDICPATELVTGSAGQICLGLSLYDTKVTPSDEEADAFFGPLKELLQALSEQGWYGRLYVFFIGENMDNLIVHARSLYMKPDDPTVWYSDIRIAEPIIAPNWLLGLDIS